MKSKLITLSAVGFLLTSYLLGIANPDNFYKEDMKKYTIIKANRSKFTAIKALNLPIGQYAITGSGALGIRNLRAIGDIDIIVTPELWSILEKTYGAVYENNVKKIVFPDGI